MSTPARPIFQFGPFRLNPNEQRLLRDGEPVALTPKAFELLLCLVERHGHLLTKEELLAAVWPDTFVEEAVLSVNMSTVRRALGDDRNGHSFIETAPRRGYRFIAPVQEIETAEVSPEQGSGELSVAAAAALAKPPVRTVDRRNWRWMVLAGAIAIVAVLLPLVGRRALRFRVTGNSVAVLPLQSLSDDPEQKHFADAMTDLLITDLGRIPQLQVVSHQSVLQYTRTEKTAAQIARELKVDCIVEGTVRREGDQVRITAQLIDGATDRHLWARSYERDLSGAFAFQSDVAESVAQEIGIKLAPKPRARVGPGVPAAAHEAYLRGMYFLDSGDDDKAIVEFRKATAADPNYSAAYTKTAGAYFDLAYFSTLPPNEAFPSMKEAALRAIEIDGDDAEAHASLAMVKLHYDWDWPGAEREFRHSLELNPSDSEVRHIYAHYLLTVGRWQESMAEMDRAFETDPVGVFTAT